MASVGQAVPFAVKLGVVDNWAELRHIVAQVHCPTGGQALYSDMRSLLTKNIMWNEAV